jgi:hypothetical protein
MARRDRGQAADRYGIASGRRARLFILTTDWITQNL